MLHREWSLPMWFDHVELACGATPRYVFIGDQDNDPETYAVIKERAGDFVWVQEPEARPLDIREWNPRRYTRMAEVRNKLLAAVREIGPDVFFSLDSDVLLHPDALRGMLGVLDEGNAVGGKVFLSEYGRECPSWATLGREGSIRRSDSSGTFPVDVIMAVKLMSPAAFAVDYRFDLQGEDIGWSKAARETGVKLMWYGGVTSKHLFTPAQLHEVDDRVGW